MEISNLYEVMVYSDLYTANIDNNVNINVKAVDFNGNPVTNKSITITCDKGGFYQGNYNTIYEQEFLNKRVGADYIEIHFNKLVNNQILTFVIVDNNGAEYNINSTIDNTQDLENGNFYLNIANVNIRDIKDIHLNMIVEDKILYTGYNPTSISTSKSITTTTKSNGEINVLYLASEWGLCTISADVNKTQMFVHGFKDMSLTKTPNNQCIFQVDESIRACRLAYTIPAITVTSKPRTLDNGIIPSKYIPFSTCRSVGHRGDIGISVTHTNGTTSQDNVNYTAGSIIIRAGTSNDVNSTSQIMLIEWRY